jgi:heme-degrading monooxygenase HmoA
MAVKILIQRKVKAGKEAELNAIVRELRSYAMHAEGFISGETLRSIDDPSIHLVISTWQSMDDWNAWHNSPKRKEIQKKINAVLAEPSKKTAFQYE